MNHSHKAFNNFPSEVYHYLMLSPFPLKASRSEKMLKKPSYWLIFSITTGIIFLVFIGLGSMLDTLSNQAYQALISIKNSANSENSEKN